MRTATPWAANAAKLLYILLASLIVWVPAAPAGEYCPSDARVGAVDLSAPVDQGFLDRMRGIGIQTIIRYYDHEDETLPGKTLRRGERNQILANGFQTAVQLSQGNSLGNQCNPTLPPPRTSQVRGVLPRLSLFLHGTTQWPNRIGVVASDFRLSRADAVPRRCPRLR